MTIRTQSFGLADSSLVTFVVFIEMSVDILYVKCAYSLEVHVDKGIPYIDNVQ